MKHHETLIDNKSYDIDWLIAVPAYASHRRVREIPEFRTSKGQKSMAESIAYSAVFVRGRRLISVTPYPLLTLMKFPSDPEK
jgi:hypothetical protein